MELFDVLKDYILFAVLLGIGFSLTPTVLAVLFGKKSKRKNDDKDKR